MFLTQDTLQAMFLIQLFINSKCANIFVILNLYKCTALKDVKYVHDWCLFFHLNFGYLFDFFVAGIFTHGINSTAANFVMSC